MNKHEIIFRLICALIRMEQRGHHNTYHYSNLLFKLNTVLNNQPFALKDVTEVNIKAVGGNFARLEKEWRREH